MASDNIYDRPIPADVIDHIMETADEDYDGGGRCAAEDKKKWAHFTPNFVDTKSVKLDLEQVIANMEGRRQTYRDGVISQREATVELDCKLPFSVVFMGDVHWGSVFTDHEQFLYDIELIETTPNMYIVFLHNLVDNAIPSKYPDNMLTNSMPPQDQFPSMQAILKRLDSKGKILAAIEADCHEGWTWAKVGVSAASLLYGYEGRTYPVLLNGSLLTVKLPDDISYTLGLWHKQGPFNSNFNKSHALQQLQRMYHRGIADVEAGGHNHVAEAMMTWYGNMPSNLTPACYVRCGSYKGLGEIPDRFPLDRRGVSGEPPGSTVLFYPDHKEMDVSLILETAVKKHMALYVSEYLRDMEIYDEVIASIS